MMKKIFIILIFALLFASNGIAQVTIWEISNGFNLSSTGCGTSNANRSISLFGNTGAINSGSTSWGGIGWIYFAEAKTGWENGANTKGWAITVNATGFQSMSVAFRPNSINQAGTGEGTGYGPRDFKLQYSLDNSTWTDVGAAYTVTNNWDSGEFTRTLPADCNNQANVYIRWIMTSNTATDGGVVRGTTPSSTLGNVKVTGTAMALAPTDISLSANTATGYGVIGRTVGTLTSTDPNQCGAYTYSLVAGSGDANNASYTIDGNILKVNVAHLAGTSNSVRISVSDGSLSYAESFTINVSQNPTTDITLSSDAVWNQATIGTTVGTLSSVDADVAQGETYTYSLVSGTGDDNNGNYEIVGNALRTTVSPLTGSTNSIRINSNDGYDNFAKIFTINITPYCTIGSTGCTDNYISGVTFNEIDVTSSHEPTCYADYTGTSTTVNRNSTYNLNVKSVNTQEYLDQFYPYSIIVRIDWNHNYSFDDPGESYQVSGSDYLYVNQDNDIDITIPATATLGSTRMRVSLFSPTDPVDPGTSPITASFAPSCGTYPYGETEDYTINIAAPTPTVSTTAAASIAATSATLGGNVTADGGTAVDDRGVVYSLTSDNANPQVGGANVTKVQIGTGTGIFSQSIGSLAQNSGYSFCAYAHNTAGYSYGTVSTFTTLGPDINIKGNSVSIASGDAVPSAGDDTDFGSVSVASGTVSHTFTIENTGSAALALTGTPIVSVTAGDFSVTVQPSAATIASGASLTFTVQFDPTALGARSATISIANDDADENPYTFAIQGTGVEAPTVTSTAAASIAATSATLGGNVTTDGSATVDDRGVVYSLTSDNANPQVGGAHVTKTQIGTGTGAFSESISGLSPNTSYSFRAYAHNSEGYSHGSVEVLRTLAAVPPAPTITNTVSTTTDVNVNAGTNSASTTYAIHVKGTANFVNSDGTLTGSEVWQTEATWGTITVKGLQPNDNYKFEVKARNADNVQTAYSVQAETNTLARLYVDASKTSGNNNGNNWADAFTSFQSALDIARPACEIWVARGTYRPSSAYDLTNTPRFYHFRMMAFVEIYGGFAGTESAISERTNYGEGQVNETIFSGDLGNNDLVEGSGATLAISNNDENCYHVFYNFPDTGVEETSVLDGCTISGGNSDDVWPNGQGGGMLNDNCYPTIRNVVFKHNSSVGGAAGLHINNSSNVGLLNLTFKNNNGGDGCGGLGVFGMSNITIYNSIFAFNSGNTGGGVDNYNSTSTLVNNTLYGNYATSYGGGIANENNGTLSIQNCIVYGNTAETSGNEIYHSGAATNLSNTCYDNQSGDVEGTITLGDGNKTSNPNFANPGIGDLRICGDSPCADAGDGSYFNDWISIYDIRGNGYSRKLSKTDGGEGTIDMGAYEYKFGVDPEQSVPTVQASNIVQTDQGSVSMTVRFTRGNGTGCAVFMKAGQTSGSEAPIDNTTYTASTNWSATGTEIGTGWFCIYNGSGANPSIDLTNLVPGELYRIEAFEYTGDPSSEKYLTSDAMNNPSTFNTKATIANLSAGYDATHTGLEDNKYWGIRYFNDLATAISASAANSTIHVSNYTHPGSLDADANTYIIDAADFVVNGTITAVTNHIQAIGTGYLVQSPAQNVAKTYPVGDGTNNYTATITCANAPTQPIKMKINNNRVVSGSSSVDFWDISGETGLNATIKLRIPKSALKSGSWSSSNQIRIFNGSRYVPVPAARVSAAVFSDHVEVTITGVNAF